MKLDKHSRLSMALCKVSSFRIRYNDSRVNCSINLIKWRYSMFSLSEKLLETIRLFTSDYVPALEDPQVLFAACGGCSGSCKTSCKTTCRGFAKKRPNARSGCKIK